MTSAAPVPLPTPPGGEHSLLRVLLHGICWLVPSRVVRSGFAGNHSPRASFCHTLGPSWVVEVQCVIMLLLSVAALVVIAPALMILHKTVRVRWRSRGLHIPHQRRAFSGSGSHPPFLCRLMADRVSLPWCRARRRRLHVRAPHPSQQLRALTFPAPAPITVQPTGPTKAPVGAPQTPVTVKRHDEDFPVVPHGGLQRAPGGSSLQVQVAPIPATPKARTVVLASPTGASPSGSPPRAPRGVGRPSPRQAVLTPLVRNYRLLAFSFALWALVFLVALLLAVEAGVMAPQGGSSSLPWQYAFSTMPYELTFLDVGVPLVGVAFVVLYVVLFRPYMNVGHTLQVGNGVTRVGRHRSTIGSVPWWSAVWPVLLALVHTRRDGRMLCCVCRAKQPRPCAHRVCRVSVWLSSLAVAKQARRCSGACGAREGAAQRRLLDYKAVR